MFLIDINSFFKNFNHVIENKKMSPGKCLDDILFNLQHKGLYP